MKSAGMVEDTVTYHLRWRHILGGRNCQLWNPARGEPIADVVRTDRTNDERESTEQRDGIIVPPYPPRIPRKAPVGGGGECDYEQKDCDIWRGDIRVSSLRGGMG